MSCRGGGSDGLPLDQQLLQQPLDQQPLQIVNQWIVQLMHKGLNVIQSQVLMVLLFQSEF